MDGTLLNDDHKISDQTIQIIERVKKLGIKVVLCSGRPIGGMKSYINTLGLNQLDDYAIAYNGALIQDTYTEKGIAEFSLNYDHLIQLYELSIALDSPMHFFDQQGLYTPNKDINHYTVFESFLNNIPLYYRDIEDVPTDVSLPKVMFIDHPERLKKTIEKVPQELLKQYTVVQSAPHFLEFVHPQTNKGFAVKRLADELGIKQEEIMSFGDNGNDLSMIEFANCGVAMGNAISEVKAVADFVTLTNNDDGVAHAIKELILES